MFFPAVFGEWLSVDDGAMVLRNPGVLQGLGLEGLKWDFTTWYWGMWHPLTWLSHQLDVSLFGLDPRGHHLVSVLLHALAVALAFIYFHTTTGQPARSALVALLFGLHPLRAESVAWVAERKDVLCTVFWIGAMILYARYRARPSALRWAVMALACAAAMLCKPMAVTLPFALLLLDFWPQRGAEPEWKKRLLEKAPLVAMSAGAAVLTVLYQQSVSAVSQAPLIDRVERVLGGYGLELWHTVAPVGLSYLYPRQTPPPLVVASSALALVALVTSAWLLRHRAPSWSFGVAWFLGVMFPTVGLVQVGAQLTADRYTYLPHLGLFAGLVFAVPPVPERWRRPVMLSSSAVVVLSASLLWGQLAVWRSSGTLLQQALARDPDNAMALHSLALLQTQSGQLDEGLATFRRLLELTPNDGFVLSNYARALLRKGDLDGALAAAIHGYQRRPADPLVKDALVQVLIAAGKCPDASGCAEQLRQISPGE